jgi:two-component system, NarL family, invasion response regulator UvrY
MSRILIADDHAIVRRGLKQILVEEFDKAHFGEAQDGDEVMSLVEKQPWDIIILDITMPGRNGLDVLKEIKQNYKRLPILVLSMHPENQFAVRMLKAGAAGYMTKESAPEELVKAVRKLLAGGRYITASLVEKLVFSFGADAERPPHESLSDREYEVLCLIAGGKSVSQVAEELSLSVKTISTYRARILEKMQMKNNAELTHYAIQNQLV